MSVRVLGSARLGRISWVGFEAIKGRWIRFQLGRVVGMQKENETERGETADRFVSSLFLTCSRVHALTLSVLPSC
jgi:hypothetical protein